MLWLDKGCELIRRSDLASIPTPAATATHQTVPHAFLADTIEDAAIERGLKITKEQYGLSQDNQRLYGSVDFTSIGFQLPPGIVGSIAVRHSHNKTMAVSILAGGRVSICSNGMMYSSGEIDAVRRRHTSGLNITDLVGMYLDEYISSLYQMNNFYDRLSCKITDMRAKVLIHDAFIETKVLAPKYLPAVSERYFNSEQHREQFPERTRWSLYNSMTEIIKRVSPQLQIDGHRRLVEALDPALN